MCVNLVINLDACRRLISTMFMTFRHEEIKLCRLCSHVMSMRGRFATQEFLAQDLDIMVRLAECFGTLRTMRVNSI